jgi:hypothetical protein
MNRSKLKKMLMERRVTMTKRMKQKMSQVTQKKKKRILQ